MDGSDALAVLSAIRTARKMAITEQRPILVEVGLNFFLLKVFPVAGTLTQSLFFARLFYL